MWFGNDAAAVLQQFIGNLGDVEANGKSAIAVLDDMGISEVRVRDALLRLSGAMEVMTGAQETSTSAWAENTALINEAEKRYETLESRMTMMGNAYTELGIVIGDGLTKPVGNAVDLITKLATAFANFLKENKEARDLLVALGTAITTFFAAFGAYLVIFKVIEALKLLWVALGAAGPLGLAVIAVGALAAGLYTLASNAEDAQAELKELIKEAEAFVDAVAKSAKAHADSVQGLEKSADVANKLADELNNLMAIEKKSAADKQKILAIVEALNREVPQLNLAYNEQADSLSKTASAIYDLIAAEKERAKSIAAQERLTELYREQIEAERLLAELAEKKAEQEKKVADARAKSAPRGGAASAGESYALYTEISLLSNLEQGYSDVASTLAELNSEIDFFASVSARSNTAIENSEGSVKGLSEKIDGLRNAYKSGELSAQEYVDSLQGLREAAVAAGEDTSYLDEAIAEATETTDMMAISLKDAEKAAEEFAKRVSELGGITGNAFSQIEQASATSLKEMQANINGNRDAMRDYYATLAELDKRGRELGYGSQVFDYMKSLGPEMIGTLKEALAEGDEAFKQFFDDYKQSQSEALLYTKYEYGEIPSAVLSALSEASAQTKIGMAKLYKEWEEGGAQNVEAFLREMDNAPEKAYEIAREIAIASGEGLAELDAEYAKKGYEAGEKLTGELAKIPGKVQKTLSGLAEGLNAPISQLAIVFGDGGAAAVYEFARSMGMTRQQAYDAAYGVAVAAGKGFSELDGIFMEETEGATNWIYLKLKEAEPKIAEAVVGVAMASGAGLDQLTVAFKEGGAKAIYDLLLELGMGEAEAYEAAKAVAVAAGKGIKELNAEFEKAMLEKLPEKMQKALAQVSKTTKNSLADLAQAFGQGGYDAAFAFLVEMGVVPEEAYKIVSDVAKRMGDGQKEIEKAWEDFQLAQKIEKSLEGIPDRVKTALRTAAKYAKFEMGELIEAFRKGDTEGVKKFLESLGLLPHELQDVLSHFEKLPDAVNRALKGLSIAYDGVSFEQLAAAFREGGLTAVEALLAEMNIPPERMEEVQALLLSAVGTVFKELPVEIQRTLKGLSIAYDVPLEGLVAALQGGGAKAVEALLVELSIAPEKIAVAMDMITGVIAEHGDGMSDPFNKGKDAAEDYVEYFSVMPNQLKTALKGISIAFEAPLEEVVSSFREGGKEAVAALLEEMGVAPEKIAEVIGYIENAVEAAESISSATDASVTDAEKTISDSTMPQEAESIKNDVLSAIDPLKTEFPAIFKEAAKGGALALTDSKPEVVDAAGEVKDGANAEMEVLPGLFGNIGENAAAALAEGLEKDTSIKKVVQAAQELAKAAAGAAGAQLEIKSPSRVFMEIGEYAGEGFAIGLRESMLEAIRAVNLSTGGLVDSMMGAVEMGHDKMLATIGGVNSNSVYNNQTSNQTINFNQPVSSPYQTARQVRKAMQEMLYGQ